jgi:hypothetical protein
VIVRNSLALGLFASAAPFALAQQCFDFADGFGTPGNGLTGPVRALEVFDDGAGPQLYAGGQFPGTNTRLVRRWDGTSWTNVALAHPSNPGMVWALGQFDGGTGDELWAGGQFLQIGGTWANNIGKWDGASWTSPGTGTDGTVRAFEAFDDGSGPALYVGGEFTQAGGLATNRIARWNGTSWSAVGSLPGHVHDLEVFDDGTGPKLYAVGNFTKFIRVWTGSIWADVGAGLFGQSATWSMAVFDDGAGPKLYVGGWMLTAGSTPVFHLARWNGASWQALPGAQLSGGVEKLFVHDEGSGPRLFVVTDQPIGGVDYHGIARWDGGSWSGLSSGVPSGDIHALRGFDDGGGAKLFLGGDFMEAGGKPSHRIARFGEPCTPVTISVHPQSFTAYFSNGWYELSVTASGTAPLSYQWRRDGVPLSDGERLEGSQTPLLRMLWWDLDDQGAYDCLVTNPVGSLASNTAMMTVPLPESGVPWKPEVVALTPEPIENTPQGTAFTTIESPEIASTGEIAFYARIDGAPGNAGLRSINVRANGADTVLHRQGDAAPGCEPGVAFSSILASEYAALAGGRVAFQSLLDFSSIPDGNEAIYFDDQGVATLVARSGTTPPGSPPGEVWKGLSGPYASDAPRVAFAARHHQGANIVGHSAWSWTPSGGLHNLLRTGQIPPGAGAAFADFAGVFRPIASTRSGILAITGRLVTGKQALWIGAPGALQLVVLGGDAAPGFGVGDTLVASDSMMLAENGDAAIQASVLLSNGTTTSALYSFSAGALQLVCRRGDVPPNVPAGVLFGAFEPRAVNGVGDILFHALMSAPCVCPSQGLFLWRNGTIHKVVTNRADPLPGAPPLYTLSEIHRADLNDLGQVVFQATLYSGSGVSCAFGWSIETGLFSICPPGSQVEIAAGDLRTSHGSGVGDNRRNGIGHGDGLGVGQSTSIDAAGNVLFTARFPYTIYSHAQAFLRAPFHYLHGAQHGPGVPYCFGDGSGAACPCVTPGNEGRGCANSTGFGARLLGQGSVSVSTDDLALLTDGLPPQVGSLLFHGGGRLNGGLGVPFENGLKCAGSGIRRLGLQFSNLSGEVAWGPGLAAQGQWLAGATRYFQVWYRDSASLCGHRSNTSNGLAVTFTP